RLFLRLVVFHRPPRKIRPVGVGYFLPAVGPQLSVLMSQINSVSGIAANKRVGLPAWMERVPARMDRAAKKSTRRLFHALGNVRDTQVERGWVKKLAPPREPLRTHLLRLLSRREKERRDNAREALDDFSPKEWKRLSHKLERKAELFPLESVVFQRVALAKLQEARELLSRARERSSAKAWHNVRIAL